MSQLPEKASEKTDRIEGQAPLIEIGQWYWLKLSKAETGNKAAEYLTCVTHVGSNYIRLDTVGERSYYRIHENEFSKKARREMDPESVIKGRVAFHENEVREKLTEIKEVTARLGLVPQQSTASPGAGSQELSVLQGTPDFKEYKKSLIQAQEKKLPELFEQVEKAHEEVATWTLARTLPMKALSGTLEGAIEMIKDRVFNISLYAGLTEEIEQLLDGVPSAASEKLRLFQRMCYMDEESLFHYEHGGMEYRDIGDFDRWMKRKENVERYLPFPKSMVAFQVRRNRKAREWDGSLAGAFVIARLQKLDECTFMYIRNGEKLFRMNCEQDFGEYLFPSKSQIDLTEPMMAKDDISSFSDIITKRDYDEEVRKYRASIVQAKVDHRRWRVEHKKQLRNGKLKAWGSPHHSLAHSDPKGLGPWHDYVPFNKTSVYFDDIAAEVEKQIKYYNRIILILQGLFDRSEVLHPHPPVKLWTPAGVETAVELIYDGASAINYGPAPDFEAYRAGLNSMLKAGSYTIGQEEEWQVREARIYNSRSRWGTKSVEHHEPFGDPGPGYIAPAEKWSGRHGEAVYRWTRERRSYGSYWYGRDKDKAIPCAITVPEAKLFNVSAYKPGDFRKFYQDPRTRRNYLQWAELLLESEEWHAGNLNQNGKLKKKETDQ